MKEELIVSQYKDSIEYYHSLYESGKISENEMRELIEDCFDEEEILEMLDDHNDLQTAEKIIEILKNVVTSLPIK